MSKHKSNKNHDENDANVSEHHQQELIEDEDLFVNRNYLISSSSSSIIQSYHSNIALSQDQENNNNNLSDIHKSKLSKVACGILIRTASSSASFSENSTLISSVESHVIITRLKGTLLNQCGKMENGSLKLLLFEALFLVERGSLIVLEDVHKRKNDGTTSSLGTHKEQNILSSQQLYALMLSQTSVSSHKFTVYSHLKRLGYIVYPYEENHLVVNDASIVVPPNSIFQWISMKIQCFGNVVSFIFNYILSFGVRIFQFVVKPFGPNSSCYILPRFKYHLTIDQIFRKLQLVQYRSNQNYDIKSRLERPDSYSSFPSPTWTVYLPLATFRRRARPPVSFFVHVHAPEDKFNFDLIDFGTQNTCFSNDRFMEVSRKTTSPTNPPKIVHCVVEGANLCFFSKGLKIPQI